MDQEKKNIIWICISGIIISVFLLVFHWIAVYELIRFHQSTGVDLLFKVLSKINTSQHLTLLRLMVVALIIATTFFQKFKEKSKTTQVALIAVPILMIAFFKGYTASDFYAIYIYPMVFVFTIVLLPLAASHLSSIALSDQKPLGINREKGENPLPVQTKDKGTLWIPNAAAGIWVEGAAGSGKSFSMVIPHIFEFAKRGYAGLVYDYEGNLNEKGGLLTKVVYTALLNSHSKVKFAFINLTNLPRTVKVNPISPKYINSFDDALEISIAIMVNLNKEWATKRDFWADNAIYAFAGTVWHFVHSRPQLATIPHVTEFLLNDFETAMRILLQDKEVAPYIRPVISPFTKQGAGGQAAGAEGSTQFSVAKLRTKESYYVLAPKQGEEMGLDITHKDHPIMLCLGNSPGQRGVHTPIIGSIIQVCRMQMNQLGKNKSIFMADELPTIYIDKLETLPAEARKKGVVTYLALQTFAQLEEAYGKDRARIIQDNCSNIFCGKTSVDSAEKVVRMMGEYKKDDLSHSYNESSTSKSVRKQYDKVIRVNDITGQKPGHFTGMVTGGEPPFFSVQTKEQHFELKEIPAFNRELLKKDGLEFSKEEVEAIVNKNYKRIIEEVDSYISEYCTTA